MKRLKDFSKRQKELNMNVIDYLISEKEALPTEGRLIISVDHNYDIGKRAGFLNTGHIISPREVAFNTITEDDLDWGYKGLVNLKTYKASSEEKYKFLNQYFLEERLLVVETFLFLHNEEESNTLYLTNGWDSPPEEEDIIFSFTANKTIYVF